VSIGADSRIGPYEVTSRLGAGGMGEVWKARDTRLHRDVAIKVLPETYAADPDRVRRSSMKRVPLPR
jgi:eukaryotic-like serine/threonine-protein kinase